jgi:hypothetical protein
MTDPAATVYTMGHRQLLCQVIWGLRAVKEPFMALGTIRDTSICGARNQKPTEARELSPEYFFKPQTT